MDKIFSIVRAGLCIIVAGLCLLPSAMMNIRVRQDMGGDFSVSLACIGSVVIAAAIVILIEISIKTRQFQRLLWCLPIFLLFFGFNLSNAVSLSGASRTAFTAPRITVLQTMKTLKSQLRTATENRDRLRAISGGMTPGMLESEIRQKQLSDPAIWSRTRNCREGHGTGRTDSAQFCGEIAAMKAKLAAARKVKALDIRIDRLNGKILDLPVVTEAEHPHIAALINVYSIMFEKPTDAIRHRLRTGSDLLFGIVVEALGAFGPAVLVLLLWPSSLMPETPARPGTPTKPKREPIAKPIDESAERFLAECVRAQQDAKVTAANLYNSYNAWAIERGLTPVNQTVFGRAAGQSFPRKRIDNRVNYIGATLKDPIRLVAAPRTLKLVR